MTNIPAEIISEISKGQIPTDTAFQQYLHWPYIDELRSLLDHKSSNGILSLMKSSNPKDRVIGIAVCKQLQFDSNYLDPIRTLLLEVWERNGDYETKWWTMFRLCEYNDLPLNIHCEAFAFVTGYHWNQWIKDCVSHFGGTERILSVIAERPGIATVASSKTWSRILQTAGGKDHQAVLSIARNIANMRPADPLVPKALAFLEQVL